MVISVNVHKQNNLDFLTTDYIFYINKKPHHKLNWDVNKFLETSQYPDKHFVEVNKELVPGYDYKFIVTTNEYYSENVEMVYYSFGKYVHGLGLDAPDTQTILTAAAKVLGVKPYVTELDKDITVSDDWYDVGYMVESSDMKFNFKSDGMIKHLENADIYYGSTISAFSSLSNELPGMDNMVAYPCEHENPAAAPHGQSGTLKDVIIHLNDNAKWSREKIADWLDELHDSGKINIEF